MDITISRESLIQQLESDIQDQVYGPVLADMTTSEIREIAEAIESGHASYDRETKIICINHGISGESTFLVPISDRINTHEEIERTRQNAANHIPVLVARNLQVDFAPANVDAIIFNEASSQVAMPVPLEADHEAAPFGSVSNPAEMIEWDVSPQAEREASPFMTDPVRMLIGCGTERRPGWIHVDADPNVNPDICCKLPPFPRRDPAMPQPNSVETIEAIHFLACLSKSEGEYFLRECYELLHPGGCLIIETPNVITCMMQFLGSKQVPRRHESKYGLWGLYGDSDDEAVRNKWGYSPDSLSVILRTIGFTSAMVKPAMYHLPDRDFRIEAVK